MLDRWSIMTFERFERCQSQCKMSTTNYHEVLTTNLIIHANKYLKDIFKAENKEEVICSLKIFDDILQDFFKNVNESKKDEHILTKCDSLKLKFDEMTDFINEEYGKEYSNLEKELLQEKANNVKKAVYNIAEHSEPGKPKRYQRKLSISPYEALKIVTDSCSTTPTTISPSNTPFINITRDISPINYSNDFPNPNFLDTINLPVPKQFEDSRRSSSILENVPQTILEEDIKNILCFDQENSITWKTVSVILF